MIDFMTTMVAFMAILGVLVFFHELGHFSAAKLVGMKVEEFAFGFGPRLVRLMKRKETEYTIRAIPLGGFVRLPGMEPGDESTPGGFNSQPIWRRALVIFAGPFASFLLGFVVFSLIGVTVGYPTGKVQPVVDLVQPGTPADRAGLKGGDRILEISGTKVSEGNQLLEIVHANPNKPLNIVVQRGERVFTINATPRPQEVEGKTIGLLGFVPKSPSERTGIKDSVVIGTKMTYAYVSELISTLTSDKIKNVGGVVGIARVTEKTVQSGLASVLFLIGMLSLGLAFINLMPWPVLDGGHLLFLFIEFVRGGRKLTVEQQGAITSLGLATLVFLMVLLIYVDINKWVSGTPLQ